MLKQLFNRYTMDQAIEDFLKAKRSKAENTRNSYRLILKIYQEQCPHWPPRVEDIDNYTNYLYEERGIADGGAHGHYRVLRTWLNWLHATGKIKHNPIAGATEPPRPAPLPRAPDDEDLRRFFQAIVNYTYIKQTDLWLSIRDLAMFGLLLESGMRAGAELAMLTLSDLDLKRRIVRLPVKTKNQKQRIVAINNPRVITWLENWLTLRESLPLPAGLDRLFVVQFQRTQGGWRGIDIRGLQRARDRYCELAGIPAFRLHDLRHAYAVYSLRSGMDLLDVKAQLGHTSLAVTMRYTQVDDKGRAERHARHSPVAYILGDQEGEEVPEQAQVLSDLSVEIALARAELEQLLLKHRAILGIEPASASKATKERARQVLSQWLGEGREITGSALGQALGLSTSLGRRLKRELLPELDSQQEASYG